MRTLPPVPIQDNRGGVSSRVETKPQLRSEILAGRRVTKATIDGRDGEGIYCAASVVIEHGLGRVPVGWFVVRSDAPTILYETEPPTSTHLSLTSVGAATFELWVF